MTDWQDISTAPKDGTLILAYGLHAGELYGIGKEADYAIVNWYGTGDYPGFDWIEYGGEAYAVWIKPTHWQPLPPPPGAWSEPYPPSGTLGVAEYADLVLGKADV